MTIAIGCGLTCQRAVGLVAATWMTAAAETWTHFNPLLSSLAFGSWLAGAMLRQRRAVIGQLKDASRAIEAESQGLAEEAVRLERARIARELHDIVAHCVSVMVVQAYAGELLTATDPDAAAEAFDQIADTASQADREIAYLVGLLVDEGSPADRLDAFPGAAFLTGEHLPAAVQSLVASAQATGLDVTLHIAGATGDLQPAAAAAAYRIVQEGITNALKHSRGSPIHISIATGETVAVEVVNGAARSLPDRLASTGGGHGLQGIRDRVAWPRRKRRGRTGARNRLAPSRSIPGSLTLAVLAAGPLTAFPGGALAAVDASHRFRVFDTGPATACALRARPTLP